MKKLTISFLAYFLTINICGQTCHNQEIKLRYQDGWDVFNVCKTNPTITFDDNKEYYWYTEFSGIKSTKGGCGGNLLNGNLKSYDRYGNLDLEENYSLGLKDGNELRWDSIGNIAEKKTYRKGEIIYWKFLNDKNYWIENIGPLYKEGTIRKVYTNNGTPISEDKILADSKLLIRTYYEYPSGQLKEEFTATDFLGEFKSGKFSAFYPNGKIKVDGQYYEGKYMNIMVGTWKYYNEDSTILEAKFKAEVVHWPNGRIKLAGGYIFNTDNEQWVKIDEWKWYDESGKLLEKKKYQRGIEVSE